MKFIIYIFTFLFYYTFSFSNLYNQNTSGGIDLGKDSCVTVSISVVGDLMCHSPQFEYAKVGTDSFNFSPPFEIVKDYLSGADFTFGNLETVTAGKKYGGFTGYPRFNTPSSYIKALKESGFDLLTTANNHSLDRGEIGIINTIKEIKSNGLSYVGSYLSESDRDSIRIYDVKGIKIAFLAYSYGTNGNKIPDGKNYLVNLIDYKLIKNDIQKAREKNPELILVYYHFGEEYRREPVKFQKDVVDSTISYGADLIIGGHPHVIQPLKLFKTKNAKLDTGLIAYSMGNFFTNQRKRFTDGGMILTLKLSKNFTSGKVRISEIDYLPTWVYKGDINENKEYKIIPMNTDSANISFFSKSDSLIMNQSYSDTREIVKKYSNSSLIKEFQK
jgi:poly-gamma-glutamate synthesis protein (capsule biosynthesis protein)